MSSNQSFANLRLLLVTVIALILLFSKNFNQQHPIKDHRWDQNTNGWIHSPAHRLSQALITLKTSIDIYFSDKEKLTARIQQLKTELIKTQQSLLVSNNLYDENVRLRRLLNLIPTKNIQHSIVAEVYGHAPEFNKHSIMINRGAKDGVFIGQTAIDGYGIMGQVITVHPERAEILLITDSGSAIPIQINRTGYITIASGLNKWHRIKVNHITRSTDIRKDDVLLSSGIGGRYPKGYPVAVITEVRRDDNDLFLKVHARPIAKVHVANTVLLLWLS